MGRVADLVATQSPLQLWLQGSFHGAGYQLVGHAQMKHGAGGLWDEWYMAFSDGRWGWLAEAQGKYYVTFALDNPGPAPAWDALVPGMQLAAGGGTMYTVAERGQATMLGAQGEIPYRLVPGRTYRFADLTTAAGQFSTIDYGDDPASVYVGQQVSLGDLGLASAELRDVKPTQITAAAVSCPNCGGSLELKAPDRAERVACPYCDSLLDVNEGSLSVLKSLKSAKVTPQIKLGTTGELKGLPFTIIGFVHRSVADDYTRFYWDEYLLYNAREGFRWLTCVDGHWNYVEPIPAGAVEAKPPTGHTWFTRGDSAHYGGKRYKVYSDGQARVDYVSGEFYWKIEINETVRAVDFIRPPYMLSAESNADELNWSLGTYVKRSDLEKAFNVEITPPQSGVVGTTQPYPHSSIYKYWAIIAAAAVAAILVVSATRKNTTVYENQSIEFSRPTGNAKPTVFFSDPFELASGQNIVIAGRAPVSNQWVYLQGDLVSEDSGIVQQFALPIAYYYGVDGGESWSEGGQSKTKYLSGLPAGTYTLRLAADIDPKLGRRAVPVSVLVMQGKLRARYWLLLLLGICILPLAVIFHQHSFEKRRWFHSDFAPEEDDE